MIAVHSREEEKSVYSALCCGCHKPADIHTESETAWAEFSAVQSLKPPARFLICLKGTLKRDNFTHKGQLAGHV